MTSFVNAVSSIIGVISPKNIKNSETKIKEKEISINFSQITNIKSEKEAEILADIERMAGIPED